MALWCNWLTRRPLKAKSPGSSPGNATKYLLYNQSVIRYTGESAISAFLPGGYFMDTYARNPDLGISFAGPSRPSLHVRRIGADSYTQNPPSSAARHIQQIRSC